MLLCTDWKKQEKTWRSASKIIAQPQRRCYDSPSPCRLQWACPFEPESGEIDEWRKKKEKTFIKWVIFVVLISEGQPIWPAKNFLEKHNKRNLSLSSVGMETRCDGNVLFFESWWEKDIAIFFGQTPVGPFGRWNFTTEESAAWGTRVQSVQRTGKKQLGEKNNKIAKNNLNLKILFFAWHFAVG